MRRKRGGGEGGLGPQHKSIGLENCQRKCRRGGPFSTCIPLCVCLVGGNGWQGRRQDDDENVAAYIDKLWIKATTTITNRINIYETNEMTSAGFVLSVSVSVSVSTSV